MVAVGSNVLERAQSGMAQHGPAAAAHGSVASHGTDASRRFLRFVDVRKTYDQRQLVVKGFNLDVAKGEFITLLGPSGSGKTTILMMLAGFEAVTGGDILVDGASVTRMPPLQAQHRHGLPELCPLPAYDRRQNLAFPLKVRGVPRGEIADARAGALAAGASSTASATAPPASFPAASGSASPWRAR